MKWWWRIFRLEDVNRPQRDSLGQSWKRWHRTCSSSCPRKDTRNVFCNSIPLPSPDERSPSTVEWKCPWCVCVILRMVKKTLTPIVWDTKSQPDLPVKEVLDFRAHSIAHWAHRFVWGSARGWREHRGEKEPKTYSINDNSILSLNMLRVSRVRMCKTKRGSYCVWWQHTQDRELALGVGALWC